LAGSPWGLPELPEWKSINFFSILLPRRPNVARNREVFSPRKLSIAF
jgi:hypothetical protein